MRREQGTHPPNDAGQSEVTVQKGLMKPFTEDILKATLRILPVASESIWLLEVAFASAGRTDTSGTSADRDYPSGGAAWAAGGTAGEILSQARAGLAFM